MYCRNCGKQNDGNAAYCASCGQVQDSQQATSYSPEIGLDKPELASVGRRLGALSIDIVIQIFTLYIGWLIWGLIIFGRGQTPGKQILGIYSALTDSPELSLSWGNTFLREFVYKEILFGILLIVSSGIVWILDYLWALWDGSGNSQTLHDKISRSSVYRIK